VPTKTTSEAIASGAMIGEPTREQRAGIDAPVDAGTLVLAVPATGKTHTLILRLERMPLRAGGRWS
jgi:hypothetical protein